MRTTFVVLFLAFLAFSAAQDDCASNSEANRLITLASASGSSGVVDNVVALESEADVAALVTKLNSIIKTSVSAYTINLAVGFANDDYVAVHKCREGTICDITAGYAYILGLRSETLFNDTLVHYFNLNADGSFDFGAEFGTEPAYFPTQRPWYLSNGWTDFYEFAAMITQGQTLSFHFQVAGSKVVLAADRISTEPCGPHLNRFPAIPATVSLANTPSVANFIGLNDQSDIATVSQTILTYLTQFQVGQALIAVGVGLENGDAYWVTDCNAYPAYVNDPECEGTRYYALTVNSAVFGNNIPRTFNLSPEGAVTSALRTGTAAYDTTSRPWYVVGNGWTPVYSYGWVDFDSRTYASSFVGGVVAADINPEASLDISCPAPSASPSASPIPCAEPSPSPAPPCGCPNKKPRHDHNDGTTINININN